MLNSPLRGAIEAFHLTAAKRTLRPELLNRLDDVVLCDQLFQQRAGEDPGSGACKSQCPTERLGVRLSLTPQARRAMAKAGYDPAYGARPLRRIIEREVLGPVATALLAGQSLDDVVPGLSVSRSSPGRWSRSDETVDESRDAVDDGGGAGPVDDRHACPVGRDDFLAPRDTTG